MCSITCINYLVPLYCQTIDNASVVGGEYVLSSVLYGNGSINLTFSGILNNCMQNSSVYSAFQIERALDLDQLTNVTEVTFPLSLSFFSFLLSLPYSCFCHHLFFSWYFIEVWASSLAMQVLEQEFSKVKLILKIARTSKLTSHFDGYICQWSTYCIVVLIKKWLDTILNIQNHGDISLSVT